MIQLWYDEGFSVSHLSIPHPPPQIMLYIYVNTYQSYAVKNFQQQNTTAHELFRINRLTTLSRDVLLSTGINLGG